MTTQDATSIDEQIDDLEKILTFWFSTVSDGRRYYPNSTYVKEAKAQIKSLIADEVRKAKLEVYNLYANLKEQELQSTQPSNTEGDDK